MIVNMNVFVLYLEVGRIEDEVTGSREARYHIIGALVHKPLDGATPIL